MEIDGPYVEEEEEGEEYSEKWDSDWEGIVEGWEHTVERGENQVSTTSEGTGTGAEFRTGERRGTGADLGGEVVFSKLKPIQ